jgi:2-methylisocitrate lyase-like PEP mutase family enzyme
MTIPTSAAQRAERFRSLHTPGAAFLMPNAWDIGSAALFASLGFEAIATTSGGFAATRGRLDGAMTKDEVLAHAGELAGAVDVPVSADLENCFAHDPDGVAATITAATASGLAGGSVEDFTGDRDAPIYELAHAADRVRAAAEAAHAGTVPFVLTARAENYLHGREDLGDTIARLQAYQEAGADVLFAPRVVDPASLRQLLAAVDLPVSVLVLPGAPTVGELAELGVSRISVGGAVAVAAYGAAINAVTELRDQGTCGYWDLAAVARPVMGDAFSR